MEHLSITVAIHFHRAIYIQVIVWWIPTSVSYGAYFPLDSYV